MKACTKGHETQCREAKGEECRCQCDGESHGLDAAIEVKHREDNDPQETMSFEKEDR